MLQILIHSTYADCIINGTQYKDTFVTHWQCYRYLDNICTYCGGDISFKLITLFLALLIFVILIVILIICLYNPSCYLYKIRIDKISHQYNITRPLLLHDNL